MSDNCRVSVIGGGAWGTALSIIANRAGSDVILCSRNPHVTQSIRDRRSNDVYLPSVFVDPAIRTTDRPADICHGDILVIAVPSHILRPICISISDMLAPHIGIVVASKGIERGSLMLMSEVVQAILPHNPVAVLSGPNFADEAGRGLPTATTIAGHDEAMLEKVTHALGGRLFRPYLTDDMIGAQIGGAVKNVIAIACGIALGYGLGENTRAALVTRGFAEMARLAKARGGRHETMAGLSGLGDLILTCGSTKSRNLSFGVEIGQGGKKDDILLGRGRSATEGVFVAESLHKLSRKYGLEMPICDAVYRILYEAMPVDRAIENLLDRPFVPEGI